MTSHKADGYASRKRLKPLIETVPPPKRGTLYKRGHDWKEHQAKHLPSKGVDEQGEASREVFKLGRCDKSSRVLQSIEGTRMMGCKKGVPNQ